MAITHLLTSNGPEINSGDTIQWGVEPPAGASLLIVTVNLRATGPQGEALSVAFGDAELTRAVRQVGGGLGDAAEIWYLANPGSAEEDLTVTFNHVNNWAVASAIFFSGTDADPISAAAGAANDSGSPTLVTVFVDDDDSFVLSALSEMTSGPMNPDGVGAGQSILVNRGTAMGGSHDAAMVCLSGPDSSGQRSHFWAKEEWTDWSAAAVCIRPAEGGPPTGEAALTGAAAISSHGLKRSGDSAAMTGSAGIAAGGEKRAVGVAALSGSADITTSGRKVSGGAADLSGSAAVAVQGSKRGIGAAIISGTAAIVSVGHGPTPWGMSTLTGAAEITAVGYKLARASAEIRGDPELIGNGRKIGQGQAHLSGNAAITVRGFNPDGAILHMRMCIASVGSPTIVITRIGEDCHGTIY